MQASLALETGQVFRGRMFGALHGAGGEIVFHTGMTGYQEILTDPSYAGQVVLFTASHLGNYGIHAGEDESATVHPAAVVVRDHCRRHFHRRAGRSLEDVLRSAGTCGLADVDTRAITRLLRSGGSCRAAIGTGTDEELVERARALPTMQEQRWVERVSCTEAWTMAPLGEGPGGARLRVAVMDYGVKRSILTQLAARGCELTIFPAATPAAEVLAAGTDGIFLSNGPGDPALLEPQVEQVRGLLASGRPLFGICLGHQLLGRALGLPTTRLPFGHHGSNHPVQELGSRRVEITSHNHNYAVLAGRADHRELRVTHRSLNDDTVEGMELVGRPVYSVQYHPEAAPGPTDAHHIFERFISDMASRRTARAATGG